MKDLDIIMGWNIGEGQTQAEELAQMEEQAEAEAEYNRTLEAEYNKACEEQQAFEEALEAENAKLEKLNSAALERLSYHACPSNRNNYGQPCNDSDDCVACWREYLGGKDV